MSRNVLIALLIAIVLIGGAGLVYLRIGASPVKQTQAASAAQVLTPAIATSTVGMATSTPMMATSAPAAKTPVQTVAAAPVMRYEIVTTPAEQHQGLGGRAVIPDNYAMLFVFPTDDTYGFWMKDMLVPIDMIWLADDGTIIKIDDSVPVDSYPNSYYPPAPVKYVLETKAGFAREHGWTLGTHVALPLPYGK